MSKDKESPAMQEMGPKRYRKMVEDNSRAYDKYKAGKRDPKTGEIFRNISTTDPNKKTSFGQSAGYAECSSCEEPFAVKTSTVVVICGKCGKAHTINHNRDTKEFTVEPIETTKYKED